MPSTSESKASRTADSGEVCEFVRRVRVVAPEDVCCVCVPPGDSVFLFVALPLTVFAEGVVFVFEFCASADTESARASVMKANFLNIAENTSLKSSRLKLQSAAVEIKLQTSRAASRRRAAERSRPRASNTSNIEGPTDCPVSAVRDALMKSPAFTPDSSAKARSAASTDSGVQ